MTNPHMHEVPSYLVNEHFDDRFFDVVNAIEEANYIYLVGNDLSERIKSFSLDKRTFTIGELGFGAGRNVVALLNFLDKNPVQGIEIDYNTVELYPINEYRLREILEPFRSQVDYRIDLLVNQYREHDFSQHGLHKIRIEFDGGVINLNLWIGEALEMVDNLAFPCDCWFLDGHGPKKNPEIWRRELLLAVGLKTVPNGTFSTFTVAREVKDNLVAAGFAVEKWPGMGGKKSVLRGKKI